MVNNMGDIDLAPSIDEDRKLTEEDLNQTEIEEDGE